MKWVNLWSLGVEYPIDDLFSAFGMCDTLSRLIYWQRITPAIPFRAHSHQEDLQSWRMDARLPSILLFKACLFHHSRIHLMQKEIVIDLDLDAGILCREILCKMPKLVSKYPEHLDTSSSSLILQRLLLMQCSSFTGPFNGNFLSCGAARSSIFKQIFDCRIHSL